jgi:hypothetical protein
MSIGPSVVGEAKGAVVRMVSLRPSRTASAFIAAMIYGGVGKILNSLRVTILLVLICRNLTDLVRLPVGSMTMHSSTRAESELSVAGTVGSAKSPKEQRKSIGPQARAPVRTSGGLGPFGRVPGIS